MIRRLCKRFIRIATLAVTAVLLVLGLSLFSKVEKTFVDTV